MEKFYGNAKEARKLVESTGKNRFRNLIFKRIREASEEGSCVIFHTYGIDNEEHVDIKVLDEMIKELVDMGYKAQKLYDDNIEDKEVGVLKIEW